MHPGKANVSKAELNGMLAKLLKVQDPKCVFTFHFKSAFGGGKSTGFALIYDTLEDAKKYEPKHRLVRVSCWLPRACSSRRRKCDAGGGGGKRCVKEAS